MKKKLLIFCLIAGIFGIASAMADETFDAENSTSVYKKQVLSKGEALQALSDAQADIDNLDTYYANRRAILVKKRNAILAAIQLMNSK